MNRVLLVSILLIAAVLAPIALSASKPDWVAPGKYAEYEVKISSLSGSWTVRWEIKEVYDTYAVVEISGQDPFTGESRSSTENWTYEPSPDFLIIVDPSYLKRMNLPTEYKTVPAGIFKCYKYEMESVAFNASYWSYTFWYEVSTGILVAAESKEPDRSVTIELKSTNIVSGIPVLEGVITIVIIVLIIVLVVWKFRKSKKPKQPLQPAQPPQQGPGQPTPPQPPQ